MSGILSRFRIEGLHNRYTIDVPIRDNKLVLIGENGSGKSTVANFIYFFLSNQWHRMLSYEFKTVTAVVDGQAINLIRKDLIKSKEVDRYLRRFPSNRRSRLLEVLEKHSIEELLRNPSDFARDAGIPLTILMDLIAYFSEEPLNLSGDLESASQSLDLLMKDNVCVLYLPTYRRIEHDLTAIFPRLSTSSDSIVPNELQEQLKSRTRSSRYIELVQFGMRDVEDIINRKINELKDSWRDDLNKLAGIYLSDVIQGIYKSTTSVEIEEMDEYAINAIFSRIDQSVLAEPEQNRLRQMVTKIRSDHRIDDEDKVVAHYLTRLIALHKNQQEKERSVREFVRVCNQYLSGKAFVYNHMSFEIFLRLLDRSSQVPTVNEEESEMLKMNMLSSGEKQIVSLFSQIYLAGGVNYFVIIDEPELSLSIDWQKLFLPDILKSGHCIGLIAVTHSPFICDNELDPYMASIEEFRELSHDIHPGL